jgi:hypothetical protein
MPAATRRAVRSAADIDDTITTPASSPDAYAALARAAGVLVIDCRAAGRLVRSHRACG